MHFSLKFIKIYIQFSRHFTAYSINQLVLIKSHQNLGQIKALQQFFQFDVLLYNWCVGILKIKILPLNFLLPFNFLKKLKREN